MICPHCHQPARILETRTRRDGKVRRRYRCAHGHTSVTVDHEPVPLAAHRARGDATRARAQPVLHPTVPNVDAAALAGVSPTTVWRLRKEAGLPLRSDLISEARAEAVDKAKALARQGRTARAIAASLGVKPQTVRRYLRCT
jgi:transposase-like protein